MKQTKSHKLAFSGICLALALILLFAGSIVPGIELTLFALSSVITAIVLIENGVAWSVLFYVAAVLLGLALIPNKLAIIPYGFLFGYYGILKFYIEKISSRLLPLLIKIIFFAAMLSVGLIFFRKLLLGSVHLPDYPVAVLIAAGVLMMLLYDFVFSLLINYYIRRFKGRDLDNMKLG